MESQRYAFELVSAPVAAVSDHDLVLFFHRVIQDKALPETCIDVTDYSHVPGGPGVMLICHEAHYSLSRARGSLRLRCATKRGAEGDTEARIRRVLAKTLRAAAALEAHPALEGRVTLDTTRAMLSIEDRLVAPNSEETFAAFAPVLARVVTAVWGASPVLARVGSDKECFQVEITVPVGPKVTELLVRV